MRNILAKIEAYIDQLLALLPPELVRLVPPLESLLQHPNGRYIFAGMVVVVMLLALWTTLRLIQMMLGETPVEAPRSMPPVPPEPPLPEPRQDAAGETVAGDDFQFFKRGDKAAPNEADAALSAIEQEMLAVRQLFADGHIVKDVYVAETRRLYSKAKMLKA